MPRDGVKVRRRLQEAALELFGARGYEQVTGAAIAERAGVTERTFFRHFADKREVLFDGEDAFGLVLSEAVGAVAPTLDAWATMLSAFAATEPLLAANRSLAEARRRVIAASPALQEREFAKANALTLRLASALQRRGLPEPTASLAAQVGMVAFGRAYADWLDAGDALHGHLAKAFHAVRALTSQTLLPLDRAGSAQRSGVLEGGDDLAGRLAEHAG